MNINDEFPSKYLKSADLQGRSVKAAIKDVTTETIGDDRKIVLYFAGKQKGMICNRTNAMTLGEVWGPETDNWIGGDLEIFSMKVPFQGKLTDGLRVRPLQTQRGAPTPTAQKLQDWQQPVAQQRQAEPNPPADDFSDDVPF